MPFDPEDFPPDQEYFLHDPDTEECIDNELPSCKVCGCDALNPCPGGCIWATPDICSQCIALV